jgi:hypothetical protein
VLGCALYVFQPTSELFLERHNGCPHYPAGGKLPKSAEELSVLRFLPALNDRKGIGVEDRHGSFPLSRPRVSGSPTQADDLIEDGIIREAPRMILPPTRRFLMKLSELLHLFCKHFQLRLHDAEGERS